MRGKPDKKEISFYSKRYCFWMECNSKMPKTLWKNESQLRNGT